MALSCRAFQTQFIVGTTTSVGDQTRFLLLFVCGKIRAGKDSLELIQNNLQYKNFFELASNSLQSYLRTIANKSITNDSNLCCVDNL